MNSLHLGVSSTNTKHLYNICTTSAKLLRRWSNIVQMLNKCVVFTGRSMFHKAYIRVMWRDLRTLITYWTVWMYDLSQSLILLPGVSMELVRGVLLFTAFIRPLVYIPLKMNTRRFWKCVGRLIFIHVKTLDSGFQLISNMLVHF